jgi:diacylglycerol kinase family enzyme
MADQKAGPMRTTTVAVLLNVAAGKAQAGPQPGKIREAFALFGMEPRVWSSSTGTDLSRAAQEALSLGYPVIVAAGGDGTVSKVAGVLVGTESALGILPAGTLNHFAKDLHLPLDLGEAAKIIAEGHTVAVDVGQVNDRIFINNTSIGIYPELVWYRQHLQKKGLSKWTAFIPAVFSVLVRSPSLLRVRLQIGHQARAAITNSIIVGNNEYEITGLQMGTRQQLDAGVLSLYLSRRKTRLGLLGLLFRALLDFIPTREVAFEARRTQEFWIETEKKILKVAVDGELVALQTPLHFKIRPHSLKVVGRR